MKVVYARADSGFYCWQAIEAYEKKKWRYIVVARKTARLVDRLQTAKWNRSPLTNAGGQCEFNYQPEGWGKACRFLALRYEKPPESKEAEQPEQYQLFVSLRASASFRQHCELLHLTHEQNTGSEAWSGTAQPRRSGVPGIGV